MLRTYVYIEWPGAPCACRCAHCLTSAGEWQTTKVPYARARRIADRFSVWARETQNGVAILHNVWPSCEVDTEVLRDVFRFSREQGEPLDVMLNGLRLRTRDQFQTFIAPLVADGLQSASLSFYGLRESHDRFAGRRGDFDYLQMMDAVVAELGLLRHHHILATKPTLHELPELLAILNATAGRVSSYASIYDYSGRATTREDWLESSDLERLPEELRSTINTERHKAEAAWVEQILRGDIPAKRKLLYVLHVREESVDRLEQEPCEEILERLRQRDEAARAARPSLPAVAKRYGDRSSQRIYNLCGLERKWYASYYAEHAPERLAEWLNPNADRMRLE